MEKSYGMDLTPAGSASITDLSSLRNFVVWDTHPVQYRGPLYSLLSAETGGHLMVIYESNYSLRGYHDAEFGREIAWDTPLLDGYNNKVLPTMDRPAAAVFLARFFDALRTLMQDRPMACLHVHPHTPATSAAYCAAALLGIPQWLRVETQDEAFERRPWKEALRKLVWTIFYAPLSRAFYIGELNRHHFLAHGFRPTQLRPARYGVVDGIRRWSKERKQAERLRLRQELAIPADALVIGFCGKFITKKDPALLLESYQKISASTGRACHLLYIGSGKLENELRVRAKAISDRIHFAGFINQQALPAYYLAMDVFVLPSRRQGETWGLVVNEALHAGCAVAMSAAVGCAADFGHWTRCRVFSLGDADACAEAIIALTGFERDFDWCSDQLDDYSLDRAAQTLASEFRAALANDGTVV
jgi:glycosyltransferase involved in cell wall biosynthesis